MVGIRQERQKWPATSYTSVFIQNRQITATLYSLMLLGDFAFMRISEITCSSRGFRLVPIKTQKQRNICKPWLKERDQSTRDLGKHMRRKLADEYVNDTTLSVIELWGEVSGLVST